MGNTFFLGFEPKLMEWIQAHLGSAGVSFFAACSAFGEETILIGIMSVLYFIYDKEAAKFVGRRFMVAGCALACIKNVVCRLRPYMVHENVNCLKPVDKNADIMDITAQGYSFPSGHSEGSAAIIGGTAIKLKKKWLSIVATVIVFLVGVSRVSLGNHYPTDVLAGWAIGLGSIFLFSLMEKIIKRKWVIYLIWIAIFSSGLFYCTTNDYFTNLGMMIGFFAGDLFEEKFAKFEKPKNILFGISRIVGALVLYFGLNTLLKLPFSTEFLHSGTFMAHLVRTVRYAVVLFMALGVYPMIFKAFKKK